MSRPWLTTRDADYYFEDLEERRADYGEDDYDPSDCPSCTDWGQGELCATCVAKLDPMQLLLPLVFADDDLPF